MLVSRQHKLFFFFFLRKIEFIFLILNAMNLSQMNEKFLKWQVRMSVERA